MLLSYLKITLKVLGRNRFFTFISLFGIVFTLLVLLLLSAFIDHLLAPHYPEPLRDRCLYIGMVDEASLENQAHRMGPPSYYFLDRYARPLKTPRMMAISSLPSYANAYVGERRFKLHVNFTDANFWELTRFDFGEGMPYHQGHIDNGDYVAVISERTRDNYFGPNAQAVGQTIIVENVAYRVVGVVREAPFTRPLVAGDIYLPYHVEKGDARNRSLVGNYVGILLADTKADIPLIQEEFQRLVRDIPMPYTDDGFTFDEIRVHAYPYLEHFLNSGILRGKVNVALFYSVIALFMFLFMLLPAINLVNLNISRIMERFSEIGIRKAFGASSGKLVAQFLVENIFITLLGGLFAAGLAMLFIYFFNQSGWLPGADLSLNGRVFLAGLGACLVFGLLSGIIPAWRMSRLQVVAALRGVE
jgi:putative ABC transport system permease protein